ncbi:MAG: AtzE family amidohydrolase [Acidobacteriota bacterium]|nr:AtzE family amidohydrolase [Acidobacteriota bacterium]
MTPLAASIGDACSLAARVRSKEQSAREAVVAALDRIAKQDRALNCFTTVLADSALAEAEQVDGRIASGAEPGALAGVPFAVKNLFDIAGLTTLAGSKINAEKPPAVSDATAVRRLREAGAILVGALNMDEYAYGFTTENTHYGTTRNPHDLERVAGGSSGGSAAAVAAGLTPLTLGSDTNGSIRVPAAFCGVFGFKPTYGRISRAGAFPFASSFDHVGPFGRSVRDIALAFDLLHGWDARDPVSSRRPSAPCLPEIDKGIDGLRIAVADGYFESMGLPVVFKAVANAARALGVTRTLTIPYADKARAAAFVITACEGANLHLSDLRSRPQDFDPVVIERFLAGALLPASWYLQAQRFRRFFREQIRKVFETVDVILAPTTPCPAITINQPTIWIQGVELPARPNIGVFTQPLSFIGLPIVSVPIFEDGQLPLGVQIIGAPFNECAVLRVAAQLEALGIARAPVAIAAESAG